MRYVEPIRDPEKVHEIEEILEARKDTVKGWRMYMLFELGIYTGLRISDIVRLKVRDLKVRDPKGGDLKVRAHLSTKEKKTGKETILPLGKKIRKVIRQELADMDDDAYIFSSTHKSKTTGKEKHIDRKTAYNYMAAIKREAGLPYSVGCHTLRKTFGYHFYKKTKRIGLITIWFNHSAESITKRYLGIDLDELTREAEGFEI